MEDKNKNLDPKSKENEEIKTPSSETEKPETQKAKEKPVQSEEVKQTLSSRDIDTLGEICNIFMGAASTTLSTLLSKKVDITTPNIEIISNFDEFELMQEGCIITEVKYTEGLEGTFLLVLKNKDSAIIADLMMGGEGEPEDFNLDELKLSAISETMSQMMGNASTAMSDMFSQKITITPPKVGPFDKDKETELNESLAGNKIVTVRFNLKIGDLVNSEIVQFMSVGAANSQVKDAAVLMENMSENKGSKQSMIDDFLKEQPTEKPQEQPVEESHVSMAMDQEQASPGQSPQQAQNQVTVQPVQFASFDNVQNVSGSVNQNLNLVMDVNLGLTVELGRAQLPIKNVLELTRGSIIELDKVAGENVELYANGKLIAKGEVVVIEDNFGLRITSIISPEKRIKHI